MSPWHEAVGKAGCPTWTDVPFHSLGDPRSVAWFSLVSG